MAPVPSRTAGSRTRQLRQQRRLTTSTLAKELAKAGIPWEQSTVEDFEEGRRPRLEVEELLAIALVLSVPPIALLVDPTISTMAVTPRVKIPTAYALLWLLGEQPLHGMTGAWAQETTFVRLARRLHEQMWRCLNANNMLHSIERMLAVGGLNADDAEGRRHLQERELFNALTELCYTVQAMRERQMAVPRLVEQETLVELGRLRGITLDLPSKPAGPEVTERREPTEPG